MQYYFFDYYLVSGASWKGVIGEEVITLCLHESWQGHKLYSNYKYKLFQPKSREASDQTDELVYIYILRNAEPTENLFFALERP